MIRAKSINILIVSLVLVFFQVGGYADIWQRHVNSNHADQLLGNDKEIWVRAEGGGLTRWDIATGSYTRFFDTHGLPSCFIQNMTYDDQGRLLVLESSKNILRYDNGEIDLVAITAKYCEVMGYADGKLYADYYQDGFYRLYYLDGENWIELPEFVNIVVCCFAADPDGGFWIGADSTPPAFPVQTESAVYHYKDGNMTCFTRKEVAGEFDQEGFQLTNHVDVDSTGIVWVTLRGGVAWYDGVEWKQYYWTSFGDVYIPFATSIARDNDGFIWAATGKDGLYRFDGQNWTKIAEYENENVFWVAKAQDAGVWVGVSTSLEHFEGSERKQYLIENLLPINNYLNAISVSSKGDLWCGDNYGDLAMLHRGTWKLFHGTQITGTEWKDPGNLNCLTISSTGDIWAGFWSDLLRYTGNMWISYGSALESEIGVNYSAIKEAPNGDIWVTQDSVPTTGIARWDGNSWTFYHPTNPEVEDYYGAMDMDIDSEGNLWLADQSQIWTGNGNEWTVFQNWIDPIFTDSFYIETITAMRDGSVWAGGQKGIIHIKDKKIVKSFTINDGLPGNQLNNEVYVNAIREAPDGTIWVLTDGGLTCFDGSSFKAYKPQIL
jgi:hypothetical protein